MDSAFSFLVFVAGLTLDDKLNDYVVPFHIDKARVRGRLVRLGPQLDQILARHKYPKIVNQYIAEAAAIAAVLAMDTKYQGVFTLQITKGYGIKMLVVDITTQGEMRACATYDEAILDEILKANPTPSLHQIFGEGIMLFSADLVQINDRYQAIVELTGSTLSESIHHFFRQSEQIPTALSLFTNREGEANLCTAGALLIQTLPSQGLDGLKSEQDQDDWFSDISLLATVRKNEILSLDLGHEELIHRLFHERGYEIHDIKALRDQCSCSRSRIESVLAQFSTAELEDMLQDNGMIGVTCDFCSTHYEFSQSDLESLAEG
jgi:molecular chaperone Hsp33